MQKSMYILPIWRLTPANITMFSSGTTDNSMTDSGEEIILIEDDGTSNPDLVQNVPPPPTTEQLRIKTEAAGMSRHEVDAVLEAHALDQIERSKARQITEDLMKSGLSNTEISRRARAIAAKQNKIEEIDFEELGIDDDDHFDFSQMHKPEWPPNYKPRKPITIPQHIVAQRDIKLEPQDEATLLDNQSKRPISRWWRSEPSPKKRTENPEGQDDTLKPAKARKLRKKPITPSTVSSSDSSSEEEDCNPKQATKTFLHFYMKQDRRSALLQELSTLHPDGAVIFTDTPEEEKKKATKALIARIKKRRANETDGLKEFEHMTDFLALMCDNPNSFFHINKLVNKLLVQGVSDPQDICGRILCLNFMVQFS